MRKYYVMFTISMVASITALALVLLNLPGRIETAIKKATKSTADEARKSGIEKITVAKSFMPPQDYSRVDVSGIADTSEKVKRILKEFEGVNRYTHNNALVAQIVEIGNGAVKTLISELYNPDFRLHGQWAKKMAIEDALNNLLTENHKETILKVFKEKDCCSKLIKKYKFPEAEDVVMDKLKYNRRADHDVIDIALMLNRERSIPLLINYVSYSTDPVHAARALATIPDIDVTEPLRKAARNVRGVWAQSGIAKLLIERGTKEGLDIAILVLRNTEEHSEYRKREISYTLGAYTDAKGDYNEMANWLEKNKDSLVWNEEYRRFK